MAKINMSKFNRDLERVISDFEKPASMKELGEVAVDRIVTRTRLGKGVETAGGAPTSLKALAQSTKDSRKGKVAFATTKDGVVFPYTPKEKPELSKFTTPGKSNLTRTGQMLDAMRVISVKTGSVVLGFKPDRKDSDKTNAEIAGFAEKDRPFFNLSGPELSGIQRFIRDRIDELLKKLK